MGDKALVPAPRARGRCLHARLSHKPPRGEFSCAPMTTTRFPVESNQLGDALDDREMGLHGVGQIGDCDPIQWPGVYATASRDSSSDPHPTSEVGRHVLK